MGAPLQLRFDPTRGGEKSRVASKRADELDSEWDTSGPTSCGQSDNGEMEQRPDAVEDRVARIVPQRRFTGCADREPEIRLGKRPRNPIARGVCDRLRGDVLVERTRIAGFDES